MRCLRSVLLLLAVLAPAGGAAQTIDPLVLCGCSATIVIGWDQSADCSQPLSTPDLGWSAINNALTNPPRYFEHTFTAPAGAYRVWLRVKAAGNSKWNDSLWVQFSDALNASNQPIYRIGTTSALLVNLATDSMAASLRDWGWVNGAYWLRQTTALKFATSGTHTIRVQVREDGVSVDQIILSAATYSTTAPGPVTDDRTRFSCPVVPGPAPGLPSDPVPAADASDVPMDVSLAWGAASHAVTYDVAFGTANPPPVVSANQAALTYRPTVLEPATTYYWFVVANNPSGSAPGPVWSFTTAPLPPPPPPAPGAVSNPSPVDGGSDVGVGIALAWTPASNATTYDVALGTANPPPVVSTNQTAASHQPGALLPDTVYYWTVTSRNSVGTTPGPVWSFRTASAPAPEPSVVTAPVPADAVSDVGLAPTLSWAPALHATTYDVAFGTSNPPPVVSSDQTALTYQPPTLQPGTTYHWSIVAKNSSGSAPGPVWSFTTVPLAPPPLPPGVVTNPLPVDGGSNVDAAVVLAWTPATDATSYDVALGTANPPPIVSANQATASYRPEALLPDTIYYWTVTARNAVASTPGPIWTFRTASTAPLAPAAVANPSPPDGVNEITLTPTLSWAAALHATAYDIAFGTSNPPPVVSSDQGALTFQPSALASGTTYFWSVVAKNAAGVAPGPVWSFTTAAAAPVLPPAVPAVVAPADLATDVAATTGLSWLPSAGATDYEVRFGTSNPPPVVSDHQSATTYQPTSSLAEGVMYFWQVVAHGAGGATPGPLWRFTTAASPPPTGDAPSVGNTNLHRLRVLTWNVKLGYNLENNKNDYALQIDMMTGLHPDIICLQEVSLSDTDMPKRLLDGLSARTGKTWRGLYQRGNTETTPTTNNIGSMILTWLPVDELSSTLFTTGVSQPFAAVHLQVTVNGAPVHVTTTHLYAWDPGVRAAQLGMLQSWLASQGSSRIVAGDFNAHDTELTMWTGGWNAEYLDAWETATSWIQPTHDGGYTFDRRTATQNPERIDYQWVKGINVSEMFVVKTRRSDHHAVVVDYRVP